MKSPTKLLPTDLIAVEVPKDATDVQVWNHGIGFKSKSIKREPDDTNGFFHLHTGLGRWIDFEILGEVTKDEISEKLKDFLKHEWIWCENEFRSLLQANGLNWVNPIEKPECYLVCKTMPFEASADELRRYREWQEAESKLIKGKLIILKPIS